MYSITVYRSYPITPLRKDAGGGGGYVWGQGQPLL
jgi:hypothetical protein